MDPKLLDILVCPICKGPLIYRKAELELICKPCRLAYPIKDDIPVMLEEDARQLPAQEEVEVRGPRRAARGSRPAPDQSRPAAPALGRSLCVQGMPDASRVGPRASRPQ